jgi:hypothetical protein
MDKVNTVQSEKVPTFLSGKSGKIGTAMTDPLNKIEEQEYTGLQNWKLTLINRPTLSSF